jgi:hypothetical protein
MRVSVAVNRIYNKWKISSKIRLCIQIYRASFLIKCSVIHLRDTMHKDYTKNRTRTSSRYWLRLLYSSYPIMIWAVRHIITFYCIAAIANSENVIYNSILTFNSQSLPNQARSNRRKAILSQTRRDSIND